MILLDTHVWIWAMSGSPKLSTEITSQLPNAAISVVSVWEVAVAIEKGRIETAMNSEQTVNAWLRRYPLKVIPLQKEVALLSRSLDFVHEDPADRFIAATAYHLGIPLATHDSRLIELPWLRTIT